MIKTKIINSLFCILHSAFCIFLMSGCAHLGRPGAGLPRQENLRLPATGNVEIITQYAYSTEPRIGYNTFEVYLENHTSNTITFKSVTLNDVSLPLSAGTTLPRALRSISLDGEEILLTSFEKPAEGDITWYQFYPSAVAGPDETVVFQINFKNVLTSQKKLTLRDARNREWHITVPRFRSPDKLITAVTYPLDYERVYVQYKSGSAPERLWLNDWEVKNFRCLMTAQGGTAPDVLAVKSPFPIATGLPIYAKIRFTDGEMRCALVRAMNGISLDACFDKPKPEAELRELGLDLNPPVLMLPFDPTCADVQLKEKGSQAMAMTGDRLRKFMEQPNKLAGLGYCTAMYPELWNIYGQIADAVYAKPYRLWRGRNVARFIDEEDDCIEKAKLSAMPRPFMWIPERFNFSGRYIEPDEMEVLAWVALARGGKGIRYHFWKNPGPDPFADCPLLLERLKAINQVITRKREDLSLLAMETERILEIKTEPATFIKIYQAWVGEKGVFVMVRNLNYTTDAQSDNKGREPRFRVDVKENVNVNVQLPQWLAYRDVRDFITDKKIPCRQEGQQIIVQLPRLEAYRLLWISNGRIR